MKQLIVFSLIVISSLTSCKSNKEEQLKSYNIKGRLMSSCNYPASNSDMFISQLYGQLTGTGGGIKDFNCDANGYFSVDYKPENSSKISLGVYGSSYILDDIPSSEDINLGNVFITRSSNIVFKIKIINNFPNILDTFYCGIYSNIHQPLFMTHPFHDTIFPPVNAFFFSTPKYPNNSYFEYGYYLKNGNQNSNLHSYGQNINACNISNDTITISVN